MLLDVMMPGLDGYEVARRVREDAAIKDVTIVILSSIGRPAFGATAADLRVARILTKPVTQSELFNAISGSLGPTRGDSAPADSISGARSIDFVSRRILLAEDGLVNQKVAVGLLTKRGHQVTVVSDGQAAIEAVKEQPFDLVLMDIQMPVLDGFAATAAIRDWERHSGGRLAIIAMTAHATEDDRRHCLEVGMDGYISKPFRAQELFSVVEETVPCCPHSAHSAGPPTSRDTVSKNAER
jgi:CheY-like chemotaxis protein